MIIGRHSVAPESVLSGSATYLPDALAYEIRIERDDGADLVQHEVTSAKANALLAKIDEAIEEGYRRRLEAAGEEE